MPRTRLIRSFNWLVIAQLVLQPILMALPPDVVHAAADGLGAVADAAEEEGSAQAATVSAGAARAEPLTAIVPLPSMGERGIDAESLMAPLSAEGQGIVAAQIDPSQAVGDSHSAPVMFIENVGQFPTPEGVELGPRFQVRGAGGTVYLAPDAIWVTLLEEPPIPEPDRMGPRSARFFEPEMEEDTPREGVNLRLSFEGANPNPQVEGFAPIDTAVSFFIGNDPEQWQSDVPVWGGVRYVDIYPGVDLEITSEEGQWAWQIVAREGSSSHAMSDLQSGLVSLRIDGAESVNIRPSSSGPAISISNNIRDFVLSPLGVAEMGVESAQSSPARLMPSVLDDVVSFSYLLPRDTHDKTLPSELGHESGIPPASPTESGDGGDDLLFSTLLGGSGWEYGFDAAVDPSGAVYITGYTDSPEFPTTPGAYLEEYQGGDHDAFVAKLASDMSGWIYVTYLGGEGEDYGIGVATNANGEAFVTGYTTSDYFPYLMGFQSSRGGGADAFVTRLSEDGTSLGYSTYLGGNGDDGGYDIAVDSWDSAYVTGTAQSTSGFPFRNAYQTTLLGPRDAFVTRIDAGQNGCDYYYSTYLGGDDYDDAWAIAVNSDRHVFITGGTGSSDFPTTEGAFLRTHYEPYVDYDVFVSRLSEGNQLVYSTYLGSYGALSYGIALDPSGAIYIGGYTWSDLFPVTDGVVRPSAEPYPFDGFVTKLLPDMSGLDYSTYLGGDDYDYVLDIAVDEFYTAYVTGYTYSDNFQTTQYAFMPYHQGDGRDAFVTRLASSGRSLLYSSYLGGSGGDIGRSISVTTEGMMYIVGESGSSNFPAPSGGSLSAAGLDAFLAIMAARGETSVAERQTDGAGPGKVHLGCPVESTLQGTQGASADPINTRTGNNTYYTVDFNQPTQCTDLYFSRGYSTFNARDAANGDLPAGVLSPGWHHNYEVVLLFSDDPGGEEGMVLLRTAEGSRVGFEDNGDGTYTPEEGVVGTLTREGTEGSYTYTYRNSGDAGYVFNNDGKLVRLYNSRGEELTLTYDVGGFLTQVTESTDTRYLTFRYDAQDRLYRVGDQTFDDADPQNPTGRYVEYGYDPTSGNLTSVRDVRGRTWTYEYNDANFPVYLTDRRDPTGALIVHYDYDAEGRATLETNGAGETIVALTFNDDETATIANGVGDENTHAYNPYRNTLMDESDAAGSAATTYDLNFRPEAVTDANGNPTTLAWSTDGANLESVVDPLGHETIFEYDPDPDYRHHLTTVTNEDGSQAVFAYNTPGTTDPLDPGTVIYNPEWDEDLLLMRIDNFVLEATGDPDENLVTTYTYTTDADAPEPADFLRRVDAPGGATCYEYSSLGQQAAVYENCVDMDPGTGSPDEDVRTQYGYDSVGRMETVTDPAGQTTRYVYHDGDDRADEIIRNYDPARAPYEDGVYNLATVSVYDAAGRLTDTIRNAYDGDLDNSGTVNPVMTVDLDNDGTPEYEIEIDPDQPEYNVIAHTNYDAAGRVSESIANYWPGQPAYHNDLYNLSNRTFYDDAGRPVAQIANYREGDLPGGGSPIGMDFDGDGVDDATLDVSPDAPEYNQITLTSYDSAGRVATTTQAAWPAQLPYHSGTYNFTTAYEYDAVGNVVRTVANFDPDWDELDGDEYSVPIQLDPTGDPVTIIVDPDAPDRNIITCTEYDALNRPTFTRSACIPDREDYLAADGNLYNLVSYTIYDDMGRQIATVRNYYDPEQNGVLELSSEYNFITRTYYDDLGRVTYTVSNFTGDVVNDPVPAYNPAYPDRNLVTLTIYDETTGRQIATVRNYHDPNGGNLTAADIAAGFPDRNLVVRTYTNARGQATHTVSNFVGDIWSGTPPTFDPDYPDRNLVTRYTYDALGRRVETITDRGADGVRVAHTDYDVLGRIDQRIANYDDGVFDPGVPDTDVITGFTYDVMSRQETVVDPLGHVRQTVYDALGRSIETIIDPGGLALSATTAYDAAGRPVQVADGEDRLTATDYDALGRAEAMTRDPGGLDLTTTVDYDLAGRQQTVTDAGGIPTRYVYDNLGRLARVFENISGAPACAPATGDQNVCTEYAYDAAGNRTQTTLGNGSVIAYTYDAMGRLLSETIDPGGEAIVTAYGYDAAGNQTALTRDPGGAAEQTTTFGYDALGRVASIDYPGDTPDVTYAYDSFGARATMTDGVGTWTYEYDAMSRVTTVTDPNGEVVRYGYDAAGNRTSLSVDGTPLDVIYAYDAANRLNALDDPFAGEGAVIDYDYDDSSAVVSVTFPNGVETVYTYDDAARMTGIANASLANGEFSSFGYTLDGRGFRTDADEMLMLPAGGMESLGEPLTTELLPNLSAGLEEESLYRESIQDADSGMEETPAPGTDSGSDESVRPPVGRSGLYAPVYQGEEPTPTPPIDTPTPEGPTAEEPPQGEPLPLQDLLDAIDAAWVNGDVCSQGVYNSLRSKIENAQTALQDNDPNNAVNQLQALINELEAQEDGCVVAEVVTALVGMSNAAIATIEGEGSPPEPTPTETPMPIPTTSPLQDLLDAIDAVWENDDICNERAYTILRTIAVDAQGALLREHPAAAVNMLQALLFELESDSLRVEIDTEPVTCVTSAVDETLIRIVNDAIAESEAIASPVPDMLLEQTAFVVDSTRDDGDAMPGDGVCETSRGECTLRAAIQEANELAGPHTITFNIGRGGIKTIQPRSPLPYIYEPVTIDGTTQPGCASFPCIELAGDRGGGSTGLAIYAGDSTVRGLVINRFGSYGIHLQTNGGNVIQGNYIGTNVAGTAALGLTYYGVWIYNSSNNTIGGSGAGEGNVISGHLESGIGIWGGSGNVVQGNLIGVDASGTEVLGNSSGLDVVGSNNTIGGPGIGEGNIISGNVVGIRISGDTSAGNIVQGNFIGSDITGTIALGNNEGVEVWASNNTIGGPGAGEGNVISGNNQYGVYIFGTAPTGNVIRGNAIGIDVNGGPLGNNFGGIRIDSGTDHSILGNAIGYNGNLGIDLGGDGVTANDDDDPDAGPNNLQNYPVLTSAQVRAPDTIIEGTLNSTPGTQFTIQFFESDTCDASGYGEGEVYLGETVETTDPNGDVSFTTVLPTTVEASHVITATATDPGGNTSEFSTCIQAVVVGPLIVDSTGDVGDAVPGDGTCDDGTGACTLRAAIEESNALNGADSISFDIPGGGPYTIQPASALPTITDPVIIDGTTQPGCMSYPCIELDGTNAGASVSGLTISAGSSTVRGLVINRFSSSGILLTTNGGNAIQGNYVGSDVTGAAAMPNYDGIYIEGSPNNTIGGTEAGTGNLISGNNHNGLVIEAAGATGNQVLGNLIGTDVTGTADLGNGYDGVLIYTDADGNIIGGATGTTPGGPCTGACNVISGNVMHGLQLYIGANGNVVQGNYIGTDLTGTVALGNDEHGVAVSDGAANNTIGGSGTGEGNVISGNLSYGLFIVGSGATGNVVQGNFIGTNAAGTAALGNASYGAAISSGASSNTIGGPGAGEGNVISGNDHGIYIGGDTTTGNVVQGNSIGTDLTGTVSLGNTYDGVHIVDADNNTIGGTAAGEGNLLSGNGRHGVAVDGATATGNQILGNLIGTDVNGTSVLANGWEGVLIHDANGTIVGGTTGTTPGGPCTGACNVISGNSRYGISIYGLNATNNQVQGSYIGVDIIGAAALGNASYGVAITEGAYGNLIGGSEPGEGNVISGNDHGLYIAGVDTTGNEIQGNFIGTDATGTVDLGNAQYGVYVHTDAHDNVIGGTTGTTPGGPCTGACNVISGNDVNGIVFISGATGNVVQGNHIGTDMTGTVAVGNTYDGVRIVDVSGNEIGGSEPGAGNLISGNGRYGISIYFEAAIQNQVLGNAIFGNGDLGIDLNFDGVTINDENDVDTGPNELQNYPVLMLAWVDDPNTTVYGSLNSTPSTAFTIQYFESDTCDVSGYGEGEVYLGETTETTDPNGDVSFTTVLPMTVEVGHVITATATDPNGNTSEFSACIQAVIAGPLVVDSTGDASDATPGNGVCDDGTGACTLRAAMEEANARLGADTINFDIPGGEPYTIQPASALPTITDPVTIDGTTQPGCTSYPCIELDGTNAGASVTGLAISAGSSTVRGLVINRFSGNGIHLSANGGNVIEGSYIGTDVTGTVALGNAYDGIYVDNIASNTIGGTPAGAGNLVSGNGRHGIVLIYAGAAGNQVLGNLIGTDETGTADLGNGNCGVLISGAPNNTIGGATAAARNVISGNDVNGIYIADFGATGNQIQGNYIGTDMTGIVDLGNAQYGVLIGSGSDTNTVGGIAPGAGNLVSGNDLGGVVVNGYSAPASGNVIQGNLIGTDVSGTAALGNTSYGIYLGNDAVSNTIGGTTAATRNVISGNGSYGILITTFVAGANATGNVVQGNYIGTDITGTSALGNGSDGIRIEYDASSNIIGGTEGTTPGGPCTGACNVISGNVGDGIYILRTGATGNVVQGNYIGTDVTGMVDLGNALYGVAITSGGNGNTIGGTEVGAGNLISGNDWSGVLLNGQGGSVSNNLVQGNLIGTDVTGTAVLGNAGNGIYVYNIALSNTIGGETASARNIISGNGQEGIFIRAGTAGNPDGNIVRGNHIGVDINGTAPLGNGYQGIYIYDASNTTIGGTTPEERNIISGNGQTGVMIRESGATGNVVQGNYIGTDMTGTVDLGNGQYGVGLANSANGNTIGGTDVGAGNLISGNDWSGVLLNGQASPVSENLIQGNLIGTDVTGMVALPNVQYGVYLLNDSVNNTVGGAEEGAGNVISGNGSDGVRIIADVGVPAGTIVQGNLIGTDITGASILGNGGIGIYIVSSPGNIVGGTAAGEGNVITGNNGMSGVGVNGANSTGNQIIGNAIFDNAVIGIDLNYDGVTANDPMDADTGPNNLQNYPVLSAATSDMTSTTVEGTLNSTPETAFTLHVYASATCDASGYGEGEVYLGELVTDPTDLNGDVSFSAVLPVPVAGGWVVTATATDPDGSTSEFSACQEVVQTETTYAWHYTYDALGRLTDACSVWNGASCDGDAFTFGYDGAGNLTTLSRWDADTETVETVAYLTNGANQIRCIDADVSGECDGGEFEWVYDAYGNLLDDATNQYTYDAAMRLTAVTDGVSTSTFAYNGDGDRVSQTVDGTLTTYVLDTATPLTMVLVETTGEDSIYYLHGLDLIAQSDGTNTEYFAYDGLGSVRQVVDEAAGVLLAQTYDPYGGVYASAGPGETHYGWTGEQVDASGLVYLRARYYSPGMGRFLNADPSRAEMNPYGYGAGNPVMFTDPSGLSPRVDCSRWPRYLGLQDLCRQANGEDDDPAVLDAREQIYRILIYGSTEVGYFAYSCDTNQGMPHVGSTASNLRSGYTWFAIMMGHYLDGNGERMDIYLASDNPFTNDPGVVRATRRYIEPMSRRDEPDYIMPLLWAFLREHVQPAVTGNDHFSITNEELRGIEYRYDPPDDPHPDAPVPPRAWDAGWWAAFGHFDINGTFSAEGRHSPSLGGYIVDYSVDYRINDTYEWRANTWTPVPLPGTTPGNYPEIPHEWPISLRDAGRAHEFDFSVNWSEGERLWVSDDFTMYRPLSWWEATSANLRD